MTGERNRSSDEAGALMGKESVARMEIISLFRVSSISDVEIPLLPSLPSMSGGHPAAVPVDVF